MAWRGILRSEINTKNAFFFFLLISIESGFNSAFPTKKPALPVFQTKSNDLFWNTKSVLLWCHFKGLNRTSALLPLLCFGSGMFWVTPVNYPWPVLADSQNAGKNTKALWVMVLMGAQSKWWCLGNKARHSNLLRKFGKGHRNWITLILLERNTFLCLFLQNNIFSWNCIDWVVI